MIAKSIWIPKHELSIMWSSSIWPKYGSFLNRGSAFLMTKLSLPECCFVSNLLEINHLLWCIIRRVYKRREFKRIRWDVKMFWRVGALFWIIKIPPHSQVNFCVILSSKKNIKFPQNTKCSIYSWNQKRKFV